MAMPARYQSGQTDKTTYEKGLEVRLQSPQQKYHLTSGVNPNLLRFADPHSPMRKLQIGTNPTHLHNQIFRHYLRSNPESSLILVLVRLETMTFTAATFWHKLNATLSFPFILGASHKRHRLLHNTIYDFCFDPPVNDTNIVSAGCGSPRPIAFSVDVVYGSLPLPQQYQPLRERVSFLFLRLPLCPVRNLRLCVFD